MKLVETQINQRILIPLERLYPAFEHYPPNYQGYLIRFELVKLLFTTNPQLVGFLGQMGDSNLDI